MRYPPGAIVEVLHLHERGIKVSAICEVYDIVESTFFEWQKKYKGMSESQITRMIDLESENRKLRQDYKKSSKLLKGAKDLISKKL